MNKNEIPINSNGAAEINVAENPEMFNSFASLTSKATAACQRKHSQTKTHPPENSS